MFVKYPRTPHLPYSLGCTSDDKVLSSDTHFSDMTKIVVTEKMDGENFSGYRDGCHARSLDSATHPSRDFVKKMWYDIKHLIPEGWRFCGENLYARHAIHYTNLPSFLLIFSIWDDNNNALSWDETVQWCELLGLTHVPVLYQGVYDRTIIKSLYTPDNNEMMEGFVVRNADSFHYDQFNENVAKFVRENHVQNGAKHWKTNWKPNSLKTI